jgi:hypothetical protein
VTSKTALLYASLACFSDPFKDRIIRNESSSLCRTAVAACRVLASPQGVLTLTRYLSA